MGMIFAYILKSALCLAVYYLFYKLLLSRETFHRFNRIALIVLLLSSMLLPLLKLSGWESGQEGSGTVVAEVSEMGVAQVLTDEGTPREIRLIAMAIMIYLMGVAVFVVRSLFSYISLWRLLRKCENRDVQEEFVANNRFDLLVSSEEVAPFSWMNYIVVSEKDFQEGARPIILHELGHIAHRHTLDLLLTEICLIVQWFNPAIWLMRRELQAIHEYEADEHVLNAGVNAKEYQLLLIKKAVGSRLQSITNSLHQSSIKNRITMMQSKKSSTWGMAKSLIALPVAAICVAVFATPKAQALTTEVCGCKVSDLFSTEQVSVPETAVSETTDDSAKWSQAYRQADEEEGQVFVVCEELPKFPGGEEAMMRYVAENVKYPKEAFEAGIQGRVAVQFIVEKDGSISFPDDPIVKSVSPELDAEAMRVIQTMPAWTPGKQRGQNIRCKFVIPITFRLQ